MDKREPFNVLSFLNTEVYPNLDAAAAGLLVGLNPVLGESGKHYELTCPSCHTRRAFYYTGSRSLLCNRREKCKFKQSLWDYVQDSKGLSHAETFAALCAAAGKELPSIEKASRWKSLIATASLARLGFEEWFGSFVSRWFKKTELSLNADLMELYQHTSRQTIRIDRDLPPGTYGLKAVEWAWESFEPDPRSGQQFIPYNGFKLFYLVPGGRTSMIAFASDGTVRNAQGDALNYLYADGDIEEFFRDHPYQRESWQLLMEAAKGRLPTRDEVADFLQANGWRMTGWGKPARHSPWSLRVGLGEL